jgi:hypothetical protein
MLRNLQTLQLNRCYGSRSLSRLLTPFAHCPILAMGMPGALEGGPFRGLIAPTPSRHLSPLVSR